MYLSFFFCHRTYALRYSVEATPFCWVPITLPGTRGTWRQRQLCICICTALLSCMAHAHLVPLSVTKRRPFHFLLNPGHVEYELGVLMVWKLSRPKRLYLLNIHIYIYIYIYIHRYIGWYRFYSGKAPPNAHKRQMPQFQTRRVQLFSKILVWI